MEDFSIIMRVIEVFYFIGLSLDMTSVSRQTISVDTKDNGSSSHLFLPGSPASCSRLH